MSKFSKQEVNYTDQHGTSSEYCSKCAHYVDETTCGIVKGEINPDGWCRKFDPAVSLDAMASRGDE